MFMYVWCLLSAAVLSVHVYFLEIFLWMDYVGITWTICYFIQLARDTPLCALGLDISVSHLLCKLF